MRLLVIVRAGRCCEYCGLSEYGQEANFHFDHIMPVALGSHSSPDNLALFFALCSLRKAARRIASDPETGERAPIFHPRRDEWHARFRLVASAIEGLTSCGRATVAALDMNRPQLVALHSEQQLQGRFPPSWFAAAR